MNPSRLFSFTVALGCYVSIAQAVTNFFVSTTGSDGNAGTSAAPFLTLLKAQLTVRPLLATQSSDIYVYVANGIYNLEATLNFTAVDSGQNGHKVIWQAQGITTDLSGGTEITDWTVHNSETGIYKASVPANSKSRHLYVNGAHAQRARSALTRNWLTATTYGYTIANSSADYLLTLEGIGNADIRSVGSFTDRYSPIDHVASNGTIIMKQPAWANNIIGYDTIVSPYYEGGFYIENVFSLLDEENEYFLDTANSVVYYKPASGVDPNTLSIFLPRLEQLLVVCGTYDDPVHDITFSGFNYMYTTWNYPSTGVGYVDQQTGGYIGVNQEYTIFEETRHEWWQVPGSVQISAANNIIIQNGSMLAVMGGIGVGNDPNAHTSGVGLGVQDSIISGLYFTQTGSNCITVGGIQADAHHPTDSRMINANILVSENIFYDTQITMTSGTPILLTYTANSSIIHNDVSTVPYSGICYGYGWGMNDEGGDPLYVERGTYNYEPLYTTPTIMTGGLISNNLIHDYGQKHTDLGGIYTLSKSPNTFVQQNYIYSTNGYAIYNDEGSQLYTMQDSYYATNNAWSRRNEASDETTGNLTFLNIALNQAPDTSTSYHDTFTNVFYSLPIYLPLAIKRYVYTSGISPFRRPGRSVSINPVASYLWLQNPSGTTVSVDVQNLGPDPLVDLVYSYSVSSGWKVAPNTTLPTTVAGNAEGIIYLIATSTISNPGTPTVSVTVEYSSIVTTESVSGTLAV